MMYIREKLVVLSFARIGNVDIFMCSGDTDVVFQLNATRFSLGQLRFPIAIPWYPWYSRN